MKEAQVTVGTTQIKEDVQVCKISHFEKKIYRPTWGFEPP